jgi:hypothetical protein
MTRRMNNEGYIIDHTVRFESTLIQPDVDKGKKVFSNQKCHISPTNTN